MRDRLDRWPSRAAALAALSPAEVRVLADEVAFDAALARGDGLISGPLGRMRVERVLPEAGEPVDLLTLELAAAGLVSAFLEVPGGERFLVEEGLEPFRVRHYTLKGENPFPVGWRRLIKNLREGIERIPTYGGPDAAERFVNAIRLVEVIARGPTTLHLALPPNRVHDALGRYFTLA